MHEYNYTKKIQVEPFITMLKMNEALWPSIETISTSGEDEFTVVTKEVLTSDLEDELIQLVNDYSDSHEYVIRYYLKQSVMIPAIAFGNDLMAEVAANNIYLQKSDDTIDDLIAKYPKLLNGLTTGSLKSAYRSFLEIEAKIIAGEDIPEFSLEEAAEFKRRLALYLGIS